MLIMVGKDTGKVVLADEEGIPQVLMELEGDYLVGYARRKVFLLALRPFFEEVRVYKDYVRGTPTPELKELWEIGMETGDYDGLVEKIMQIIGITKPSLN